MMTEHPWSLADIETAHLRFEQATSALDRAQSEIQTAYRKLSGLPGIDGDLLCSCVDSAANSIGVFERLAQVQLAALEKALDARREQVAHPELVGFEHS